VDQVRAGFGEELSKFETDVTNTLNGHGLALEATSAVGLSDGSFDTTENAECGVRSWVTGTTPLLGHTCNVVGFREDVFDVIDVGVDVLRSDVTTVERFDEAAKGTEESFRLVFLWISDDDGLSTAEVK